MNDLLSLKRGSKHRLCERHKRHRSALRMKMTVSNIGSNLWQIESHRSTYTVSCLLHSCFCNLFCAACIGDQGVPSFAEHYSLSPHCHIKQARAGVQPVPLDAFDGRITALGPDEAAGNYQGLPHLQAGPGVVVIDISWTMGMGAAFLDLKLTL